jgi:RHS repeat-associated protein
MFLLHWDDKLTLEFGNSRPCLDGLDISRADDIPTVFLAGDSTVTDQPREPTTSWGQMLTAFFNPGVAIANHAESGETLKSFITGLRLDKILSQMKKGDYLFIQFGHNETMVQTGTTPNPFTFQGAYGVMQEGATGLYYMRARYYDSASARFLSRDPLGRTDPRAINPYQFAYERPVEGADPTGLESVYDDPDTSWSWKLPERHLFVPGSQTSETLFHGWRFIEDGSLSPAGCEDAGRNSPSNFAIGFPLQVPRRAKPQQKPLCC